jgi:hypothetical protein
MTTTGISHRQTRPEAAGQAQTGRAIGGLGTAARLVAGLVLLGLVVATQAHRGFEPLAWILALVGIPAVMLAAQWLRSRWFPASIRATGPIGHAVNLAVIIGLNVFAQYAPSPRTVSDGVLLFYVASMLLAATRGYAGCEVLAISNWLLRRDDQVGCVFFAPIDHLDRRRHDTQRAARQ